MSNKSDYKALSAIASFVDGGLQGLFSMGGLFVAIFVLFAPVIVLLAFIKWLFINGYIG